MEKEIKKILLTVGKCNGKNPVTFSFDLRVPVCLKVKKVWCYTYNIIISMIFIYSIFSAKLKYVWLSMEEIMIKRDAQKISKLMHSSFETQVTYTVTGLWFIRTNVIYKVPTENMLITSKYYLGGTYITIFFFYKKSDVSVC